MFIRIKNDVLKELKNNWLVWTIAVILFFLFLLIICESSMYFTTPKKLEYTAAGQNYSDETMAPFTNQTTVLQTFVSERNTMSRIQIPFHISSKNPKGTLNLVLKDSQSGKVVFKETISLSEIKDGKLTNFDFPKISGTKGKKYELEMKANGIDKGNSVTVWKSTGEHYKQGQLMINGRNVSGDIRFSVFDVENKLLISQPVYAILGALFLLLYILSVPLLKKYQNEMHKAFLVTALPIGLILAIIIPPFDQLDEFDHFLRSYEVSEGMFVNQVTNHGLGNYIPTSLVDTVHKTQFINGSGYQYGIANEAFETKVNASNRMFIRNYASSYPPTIYIPQALGVSIGRMIFDSPMMMMYLGRIFNLLAYVLIVYHALKIVPVKKKLFYVMALLPMSINQAASLSGDSMIISSAFLFVAYVLYLAFGKVNQITKKHVLKILGIGIFIGVSKIVYLPMVLLFFMIPLKKYCDKKDFIKKGIYVLAGFIIPYLIWNWLNLANLSIPDVRTHAGVMPKEQVSFIITHPFQYIKILMDSFINLGESKFLGMLGSNIAIYHYSTPDIVIYTFLFLMILFGLMNDETDLELYNLRKVDKPIMLFTMSVVILLIYTALYVGYTSVGHSIINGVQGRYFIPVALFLFLCLSNRQFISKNKKLNFLLFTLIHCCMYIDLLVYVIQINTY